MAVSASVADDEIFGLRLTRNAPDLWPMLDAVYGAHPGYETFKDQLLTTLRKGWNDRPADLKLLDLRRDLEPDWFQRPPWQAMCFTSTVLPGRCATC